MVSHSGWGAAGPAFRLAGSVLVYAVMSLGPDFLICKMGSNNILLELLQGLTHAKALNTCTETLVPVSVQNRMLAAFPHQPMSAGGSALVHSSGT